MVESKPSAKSISMLSQSTTAIGSLPHHNIDAALEFSFQTRIPFLPQIPIRNPWEYMIAQALEGIPGMIVENDGATRLDLAVWTGRSHAFNEKLLEAFSHATRADAFSAFEPSAAASSSWQPFLWELEERKHQLAKIQLAGPLTSQWVLQLKDGRPADLYPEVGEQLFRLVLARAIAMSRRLQAGGIQPLFFLDEPGLYGLSTDNPRHVMGLQQLKVMVQALRKEGVLVGLHCCSNTSWSNILALGLDVLSIDAGLSLDQLLETGAELEEFLGQGGRLSLGVIPTSQQSPIEHLDAGAILAGVIDKFARHWVGNETLTRRTLREAIYTPACGLALRSTTEAGTILDALLEFGRLCEQSVR